MKRGRTIVAERERIQSASERTLQRQKQHRKRNFRLTVAILMAVILVVGAAVVWKEIAKDQQLVKSEMTEMEPTAEIVDESGSEQIPTRVKKYVALLEQDLAELGYKVSRVALPSGMMRELYVDIDGQNAYYKVNTDRGTGVTAEDIDRMARYLGEKGVEAEYVDVRVEGKGFYK